MLMNLLLLRHGAHSLDTMGVLLFVVGFKLNLLSIFLGRTGACVVVFGSIHVCNVLYLSLKKIKYLKKV